MKDSMLYKLESLRGIAALMVLIHHSGISVFETEFLFVKSAWLFVDFFFVLSGFVMCLAYKNKINNGFGFKEYFSSRIFRLYPLHAFVLFLFMPLIGAKYYLYSLGFGGTDPALTENTYTFLTTFFLLNSLGFEGGWNFASWSISAEFVAYIIFYFLIYFINSNRNIFFISILIAIFTYLVSYFYFGVFTPFTSDFGFLRSIPAFLLGVALFIFYSKFPLNSSIYLQEFMAALFLVVSISLSSVNTWFSYLAIVSFIYCVYVFSSNRDGFLGRLLSMKFPKLLGKYSYSIYMTHMLIVIVVEDFIEHILGLPYKSIHGLGALLINTALLIVVITLSHFTFKFIEKPGRDFGKTMINRGKGVPVYRS